MNSEFRTPYLSVIPNDHILSWLLKWWYSTLV